MSHLAVTPFNDTFTTTDADQKITGSVIIQAIRVKMIKHGTIADGELSLEVLEGAKSLGGTTITAAEFNSITGTFAWGYWAFNFDEAIAINVTDETIETDLTFRFTMSGHTEDNDNYVGLIRQFESTFVPEFGDRLPSISPEQDGWQNPWGIEIFTLSKGN